MLKKSAVLVAEDDATYAANLRAILEDEGYEVSLVDNGIDAVAAIESGSFDLGFLDIEMPGKTGLEVIKEASEIAPDLPLIILTGFGSVDYAVQAMQLGAFDFIEKDTSLERIIVSSRNALQNKRLVAENKWMRRDYSERYAIVGNSPLMQNIFRVIEKVAPTSASVIITGESGTGKELIARALHENSTRVGGPFIKLNCAAIPETLIESELFGHKKGAFTGADRDRPGKFEAANNGTLFLDEIGEMSPAAQAKVLRALEAHEFEAIGDVKTKKVDVRIISATNRDLDKIVADGRLRTDLYYRLNEIIIKAPPLRERKEDIPALANHFLGLSCDEHNRRVAALTPAALMALSDYDWPGNVREFKSMINKAVIFAESDLIDADDIKNMMGFESEATPTTNFREAMKRYERKVILTALISHDWNVTDAADALGLDRTNLHKKMQKLGIHRGES